METLEIQRFADLAKNQWLQNISPRNRAHADSIYDQFQEEMSLDPFDLVWQSRKAQDVDKILNALKRFYERCLARGLTESSAWQYQVIMKGYFIANRIRLPTRIKKPNPRVALNGLFNEQFVQGEYPYPDKDLLEAYRQAEPFLAI